MACPNNLKNIVKDENYKVKSSLNEFSNNKKSESKDDSIDLRLSEIDGEEGIFLRNTTIKE